MGVGPKENRKAPCDLLWGQGHYRAAYSVKKKSHNVLRHFKSSHTCSSQMHSQAAIARLSIWKSHCTQNKVHSFARAEGAMQPCVLGAS